MPNWIAGLISQKMNKKNWGYQFRFGLITTSEHDMQLIAKIMQATINTK